MIKKNPERIEGIAECAGVKPVDQLGKRLWLTTLAIQIHTEDRTTNLSLDLS